MVHGTSKFPIANTAKVTSPTSARSLARLRVSQVQLAIKKFPLTIAAKQCYHCQGLGHVQADCPTLRLSGATGGGRCYTCGQPGHLAVCRIVWSTISGTRANQTLA